MFANFYAVGIVYNGHSLIYKRDKTASTKSIYKVDNEVYSKVGRGQPQFVSDLFNIHEVELLRDKVCLNFWDQMQLPFLTDKSATDPYEFLTLDKNTDSYRKVYKQMRDDFSSMEKEKTQLQAELDVLKSDTVKIEKQLSSFGDFDFLLTEVLSFSTQQERKDSLILWFTETGCIYRQIVSLQKELFSLSSLSSLDTFYSSFSTDSESFSLLSSLLSGILSLSSKIEQSTLLLSSLLSLDSLFKSFDFLTEQSVSLPLLRSFVESLSSLSSEISSLSSSLSSLSSEISQVTEELNQFDVCPLCGSELSKEW